MQHWTCSIVTNNPVQVVLVGCGAVSQTLYSFALHALEKLGEAKVRALIDPSDSQRLQLLKSFPGAATYTDLSQCPLDPDTLVIVASPPKYHAEHSKFALQQGVTVLCEKPIARTSDEAGSMIAVSEQHETLLAVGHFRRFFPASQMLRTIFERRPFGNLKQFSIHEGGKFAWGVTSPALFQRDYTPGGVFYDTGVHVIDLLLWWLGEPLESTYSDDAMGGLEANCRLDLTYAGNARGTVRLSRDWATSNQYIFQFEGGKVVYDVGNANRLGLLIDGLPLMFGGDLFSIDTTSTAVMSQPTSSAPQSFTRQLQNVINAMRGEEPLLVSGNEAIRSLRFIEDCYRKRSLIEMPWLDPVEWDAALCLSEGN
jgi:predicted dehydrogenase